MKSPKKIAVIGPTANPYVISDRVYNTNGIVYGGGGSSRVHPWYVISDLDGIRNEFLMQRSIMLREFPTSLRDACSGLVYFVPGMERKDWKLNTIPVLPIPERCLPVCWNSRQKQPDVLLPVRLHPYRVSRLMVI